MTTQIRSFFVADKTKRQTDKRGFKRQVDYGVPANK
jgi:hypothetical protein